MMDLVSQVLLGYMLAVNIFTFVVFGRDKRQAVKQRRRVPEKKLLKLILAGGVLGAIAGMNMFRHKTLKGSFLWKFWLAVVFWIVVVLAVLLYR